MLFKYSVGIYFRFKHVATYPRKLADCFSNTLLCKFMQEFLHRH